MQAAPAPSRLWRWACFAIAPFLLALSASVAINASLQLHRHSTVATSPSIDPLAQLMELSPVTPQAAPSFLLTDQYGHRVGLANFRGDAVLLAFLDSRCTEVCPVIAEEIIAADRDLGRRAQGVTFVGVNVNPSANSVADVARFSAVHGLSHLSNWHFLTGSAAQLRAISKAYGIEVEAPRGATQTVHADYLFFLDPRGNERFIASPSVLQRPNGTGFLPAETVRRWGQGIATYLEKSASL